MNPYLHSKISVNKRGGCIDDYYPLHSFLDSTKELCSDNRHRILHNHWGLRRVIIPIFGHTIINSDGKEVNVKDMLEQDHILPDFNNKFIPILADFTNEMEELSPNEKRRIDEIFMTIKSKKSKDLMLSPLDVTGNLKSLRITFSSWFIRSIIPNTVDCSMDIEDVNGLNIFENMNFKLWMDNGSGLPRSVLKIKEV